MDSNFGIALSLFGFLLAVSFQLSAISNITNEACTLSQRRLGFIFSFSLTADC